MQITISGRHVTVTDAMKAHIEGKLNGVLDVPQLKITSVKVVLDVEKDRCKAEVIVNMKNHTFEADDESRDMYQSIDAAIAKIDHQITHLIDKLQDHRGKEHMGCVCSCDAEDKDKE
jgi:putative sigma-54 modulation protein